MGTYVNEVSILLLDFCERLLDDLGVLDTVRSHCNVFSLG